jgi:hypothetical protein
VKRAAGYEYRHYRRQALAVFVHAAKMLRESFGKPV